jgi:hypothetical protein
MLLQKGPTPPTLGKVETMTRGLKADADRAKEEQKRKQEENPAEGRPRSNCCRETTKGRSRSHCCSEMTEDRLRWIWTEQQRLFVDAGDGVVIDLDSARIVEMMGLMD